MNTETPHNTHRKSDLKLISLIFLFLFILFIVFIIGSALTLKALTQSNWGKELTSKTLDYIHDVQRLLQEESEKPQDFMRNKIDNYNNSESNTSEGENSVSNSTTETFYSNSNDPSSNPQKCYRYQFTETQFGSNKCYSGADYELISYYHYEYNYAKLQLDGMDQSIEIACKDEKFEQSCKQLKSNKIEAEAKLNQYRTSILNLISKGVDL